MKPYDLTLAAEEDLRGIWRYTYETWGFDQAETYFDRMEACCEAVGHKQAQSKTLDGLPDGIRINRCEQHYIVWLDEAAKFERNRLRREQNAEAVARDGLPLSKFRSF